MTEKPQIESENLYRKALLARFKKLKTKHTFEQAEDAVIRLKKILEDKQPSILDGIGISLLEDHSDFILTVLIENTLSLEILPSNIDEIEVKAIQTGPTTSGLKSEID